MLEAAVRRLVQARGSFPLRPFKRPLYAAYRAYVRSHRGRRVVARIDGLTYELDLGEDIDSTIYFRGAWEPEALGTIREIVRPGMTVLDIGANMGYFTLVFSQLVGDGGHVVAFEPIVWALEKLRRNAELNRLVNVAIEPLALSDARGERDVPADFGAFRASWTTPGGSARSGTERVRFDTLDAYVDRVGLSELHFVKIDVDGYELRVVRGAERTLRRHRPNMMIEIGRSTMPLIGDDPRDLAYLLADLGYGFETQDRGTRFATADELLDWLPAPAANIYCEPR